MQRRAVQGVGAPAGSNAALSKAVYRPRRRLSAALEPAGVVYANSIRVVAIGCCATECGREMPVPRQRAGAKPVDASSDAYLAPRTKQCKTCCKLLET